MPRDSAYDKSKAAREGEPHDIRIGDSALLEWVSFAKTQAVTTELLQFELDALADALEFKARAIIEAFEELVALMHQNPAFERNAEVTRTMSSMVRSLQFQDIAKQKLENISNALKTVHNYANNKIRETNTLYNIDISEVHSNVENMDRVITDRTLAEMRKSMMRNLENLSRADFERMSGNSHEAGADEDNGSNVELF